MGVARGLLAVALTGAALPAAAYTPGSGTLFSESFNAPLDPDWEQGNGVGTSPWTQALDGPDRAFYADGYGPFPGAATRHWARHFTTPAPAETFSAAFEHRGELTAGYVFDFEVEQRAPSLRKVRLRIDETGALSLWRTEGGSYVFKAGTAAGLVPVDQKRWLRIAIESDPSGHPRVGARVWSGGATAEPASGWTIEFLDDLDTLERVHRFELSADGPPGIRTWIDDLDVYGDGSKGCLSSVLDISMVELSHLDIGFTEPPDDIEAFAKSHLDDVLSNLAADPDYHWTIESAWWLDRWWDQSTDIERQNMIGHLQGGRLHLAAGYANLHTTAAAPEELIRNVYWASRLARDHGFPLRTWITNDVPGSTFAIPELLSRSGIDYYLGGMNTTFGGRLDEPGHGDRPFWWEGPDGSRVLAWITFDSYAEGFNYGFSFFDNIDALHDKLCRKLPEMEEAGYDYPELMLLRGFDNHYQNFHVRNLVDQWNATYETPVFILSSAEGFLDMMLSKYGAAAFPTYTGDFGAAWSGSHASAQHTTEWVRQAHREGRDAEALLAAGGTIDDAPAPRSDIDFLVRRMLEVDEHSGAGGWPEYFTQEEMDRNNSIHLGYAIDARDTADRLLQDGLDRVLADIPAEGDAVIVVNPLGVIRDGWARAVLPTAVFNSTFRLIDRAGATEIAYQSFPATEEILFRASSVPPTGYRVYDLSPGTPTATPPGTLSVTATTLENDFLSVVVDASDGSLTSLYDKTGGREMIDLSSAYRFNRLASNTKNEADTQSAPVQHAPGTASTAVTDNGPLLASVRVTRSGTPHVETTYRLYRQENRIEIENVLDRDEMPYVNLATAWRGYFVTFPFDVHGFNLRTETATRFLDPLADGFARTGLFDWHNVEHSMAFWDSNGGVVSASDAIKSHHFENLSTLTSGSWSNGDALLLPRMKDKGDEYRFEDGTVGPYEIEPGTSPIFRTTHHFRPTGAGFDPVATSRFGLESLSPLRARYVSRRPGNLPHDQAGIFRTDDPNVLLATVKPAEDGDGVILRVRELAGTAPTVRIDSDALDVVGAERVEADEEGATPLPLDAGGALLTLGAYETATVRLRTARTWAPILITAERDDGSGSVHLEWTGGVSPFTLRRADDARFLTGMTTLVDEVAVTSHDDPVLGDGRTYFYLAF